MSEEKTQIVDLDPSLNSDVRSQNFSKFKNLGKEKFQDNIRDEINPEYFLKQISIQNYFKLSDNLNDYYINFDLYPFIWLSEIPALKKIERQILGTGKVRTRAGSEYAEIKKYFAKYLTQRNNKEKQFFALSTINLIKKNTNNQNFIKFIYQAVIHTYDDQMFNEQSALNSLEIAQTVLKELNMDEPAKNEFNYLIEFHKGLIYKKINEFENASNYFKQALEYKKNGMAALFQDAALEAEVGNDLKALNNISKIIEFDNNRLCQALEKNSITEFNFFVKNAMVYHIFTFKEFSDYASDIEYILSTYFSSTKSYLNDVLAGLERLNRLEVKDYMTDEFYNEIDFLENYIHEFRENRNNMFLIATRIIVNKYNALIDNIVGVINNIAEEKISSQLGLYDIQISDAKKESDRLNERYKVDEEILRRRTEERIKESEEIFTRNIQDLEEKLEHLNVSQKYDGGTAFSNAMGYNIMISLIIAVIGGFGGAFLFESESKNMMANVLVSGVQWGGITFVLGIVAALFSAGNTLNEKSRVKHNLLKKIGYLKNRKESEINRLHKKANESEKELAEEYKNDREQSQRHVEQLINEKNKKTNELREMARERSKEIIGKLKDLRILLGEN